MHAEISVFNFFLINNFMNMFLDSVSVYIFHLQVSSH